MARRHGLRISEDLTLPEDAVTETFAILAKRGRGKSYTASVMAEEMIEAGLPVLIIDPLGVWWGLRASADGRSDGLPVVIFGGDHADVEFTERSGELLADVIVEQQFPAIIDLSLMSKSAMRRFMAPFIERLYQKNRDPLHVIVDEADAFAPQRPQAEGARLLGAMEDLQRRGRARGIGTTLITQRPAVLHKDVLTQAEVLIALGMTGPRDVAAIDEWVRLHADEDQARAVKASLPSLPVGTAWVWSPGYLDLLAKVRIRARRTFDSSATPKPGVHRPSVSEFAQVDTGALTERIAAAEARQEDSSPRGLRLRIAELEKALGAARKDAANRPPDEVRVEVPVLSDVDRANLEQVLAQTVALSETLSSGVDALASAVQDLSASLARHTISAPAAPSLRPPRSVAADPGSASASAPVPKRPGRHTSDTALPKAQRAVLSALAQHGPRSVKQVALLTGYSHTSGGYRNSLSALRSAGYIEGRGDVTITVDGLAALGDYEPLPTGPALIEWWKDKHLGKAERMILDVLVDAYPAPVSTEEIALRTGYSATSGGFRNALSRLRSLELASGRGELVLDSTLAGS